MIPGITVWGADVRAYIVRRLLLVIPTVLLVTILVFMTIRLIPGSALEMMLRGHGSAVSSGAAWEENIEALRHDLGLDVPAHVQYGRWIWASLQGDLGRSLWSNIPVTTEIFSRLPVTVELGLLGMLMALLMAIPIGLYSAMRPDTVGDYLARSLAIAYIAFPGFWIATMLVVFPSVWWGWIPPVEYVPFSENPIANLAGLALPAFILGMSLSGTTMRMTRTLMLEVLSQDYIRTAWAKGLREGAVVTRHALKNALIPLVTIVGINLPILIGGSVIIERIFNLPGTGRLALNAVTSRDYTLLSGINLLMASFVLVVNLLVDLAYGYLDPRVRY